MKHGRLTDSSAIYDYRYHKTVTFQEGLQQKTLGKKQASLNWARLYLYEQGTQMARPYLTPAPFA